MKKQVTTPGQVFSNNIILEQIRRKGNFEFMVKKPEEEAYNVGRFELGEDVIFWPMPKCPWLLPSEATDYNDAESLFKEIHDFTYEHLDISKDDRYYDLMTTWIMADWVQKKFIIAPYLHFHGPPNSGKSRGLEILRSLGFRCLLSPSISPAALYRTIEVLKPTFLMDEAELYTSKGLDETKREVLSVLNAGYRRGQVVIRADAKGEELKMFDVWGFKALGSVQTLPTTLAGRAHHIPMMRATRKVKRRIDEEVALQIRNKLLMYRFDHLLEKPEKDINPLNIPDGRLIEIFTPLILVAPNKKIESTLVNLGEGTYNELIEEERTTAEAEIFFIIDKLMKQTSGMSELSVGDIVEQYNLERTKKEKISNSYCGRLLKTLNFRKKRMGGSGRTAVILETPLIERLKYRYGIANQKTLSTPLKAIVKLTGLPVDIEDECKKCGFQGHMKFQADYADGTYGLFCEGCGLAIQKELGELKK